MQKAKMGVFLIRCLFWGACFIPWGLVLAAVFPHDTVPYKQWLIFGGLLSFLLVEFLIFTSFQRSSGVTPDTFFRPKIGAGTLSMLFGGTIPAMIIALLGRAEFPWAWITLGAVILSQLVLIVLEYLSWCTVVLTKEGIRVRSFGFCRSALYVELAGACASDDSLDFIALHRGGLIRVGGKLLGPKNASSWGHILFGRLLNSSKKPYGGHRILARYLSIKCSGSRSLLRDDVTFFLTTIRENEYVGGLFFLFALAPAVFFPLLFCATGFSSLLLLVASIVALSVYRQKIVHRRQQLSFLKKAKGSESLQEWMHRSVTLWNRALTVSIALLISLFCFRIPIVQTIPFITYDFVRLVCIVLPIATILTFVVYFLYERKVDLALEHGSPEVALRLIKTMVANQQSRFLSARRAYSLAVSGGNLTLALELARRELALVTGLNGILYSALAAARVYQLKGDQKTASVISQAILLQYPQIREEHGIRGRIAFEAGSIK